MSHEQTQICRRCGECCKRGGPALHTEDIDHFHSGVLGLEHVVTLRRGELANDQPTGAIRPLEGEIVKLRAVSGKRACIFYLPAKRGCVIYEHRPAECRALQCSAPEALNNMYAHNRLSRRDLLPKGHPLLELMDEHEHRCAPAALGELARKILDNDDKAAKEEIGVMLTYDREVRALVPERAKIAKEALPFLFGRPLTDVLQGFGLTANRTPDGIRLTKKLLIK